MKSSSSDVLSAVCGDGEGGKGDDEDKACTSYAQKVEQKKMVYQTIPLVLILALILMPYRIVSVGLIYPMMMMMMMIYCLKIIQQKKIVQFACFRFHISQVYLG